MWLCCDSAVWQALTSLSEMTRWHFTRWSRPFKDLYGLSKKTQHLMTMYSTGQNIAVCCLTTCIQTSALYLTKSFSRCWASLVEHKFLLCLIQITSCIMLPLTIGECDLRYCHSEWVGFNGKSTQFRSLVPSLTRKAGTEFPTVKESRRYINLANAI